jgi:hypothetical protein
MKTSFLFLAVWALSANSLASDVAMPASSAADTGVTICYNYGCYIHARVEFTPAQLDYLARMFAGVGDAATERKVLGRAIGRMYYFAGDTTPIWHDHGLNFFDDGVNGKMDCIDHSHNTDEFLHLLDRRGLLRYHDVRSKVRRMAFLVAEHWTARVADKTNGAEYAVDSWYFDPGEPAAVMPIADWYRRKDPRG